VAAVTRRARKTLEALRSREQRRTRDPVPAALLAKYLRVRPKAKTDPCASTSTTKKPARS